MLGRSLCRRVAERQPIVGRVGRGALRRGRRFRRGARRASARAGMPGEFEIGQRLEQVAAKLERVASRTTRSCPDVFWPPQPAERVAGGKGGPE